MCPDTSRAASFTATRLRSSSCSRSRTRPTQISSDIFSGGSGQSSSESVAAATSGPLQTSRLAMMRATAPRSCKYLPTVLEDYLGKAERKHGTACSSRLKKTRAFFHALIRPVVRAYQSGGIMTPSASSAKKPVCPVPSPRTLRGRCSLVTAALNTAVPPSACSRPS